MTRGVTVPSCHALVSWDITGCFCHASWCRNCLSSAISKGIHEKMVLQFFVVVMWAGKRFCQYENLPKMGCAFYFAGQFAICNLNVIWYAKKSATSDHTLLSVNIGTAHIMKQHLNWFSILFFLLCLILTSVCVPFRELFFLRVLFGQSPFIYASHLQGKISLFVHVLYETDGSP